MNHIILQHLNQLSQLMISEFDDRSEFYWFDNYLDRVVDQTLSGEITQVGSYPTNQRLHKLSNQIKLICMSPFIPSEISIKISKYYSERFFAYSKVVKTRLSMFSENANHLESQQVFNLINSDFYHNDIAISQVEVNIKSFLEEIRTMVFDDLSEFRKAK